MSCLLSRSSDRRSQHFCDVCKYMFRMDRSNEHNNSCSNHVFKVYAFCHYCSTVHEVPHRLGSTMMCLSNSSLSNTTHCNLAHPTTINNESTTIHRIVLGNVLFHLFFQCGVAWRIKLVPLGSSQMGPFHDFVKDAWWQKVLVYD